jgi:hypothetical protein
MGGTYSTQDNCEKLIQILGRKTRREYGYLCRNKPFHARIPEAD